MLRSAIFEVIFWKWPQATLAAMPSGWGNALQLAYCRHYNAETSRASVMRLGHRCWEQVRRRLGNVVEPTAIRKHTCMGKSHLVYKNRYYVLVLLLQFQLFFTKLILKYRSWIWSNVVTRLSSTTISSLTSIEYHDILLSSEIITRKIASKLRWWIAVMVVVNVIVINYNKFTNINRMPRHIIVIRSDNQTDIIWHQVMRHHKNYEKFSNINRLPRYIIINRTDDHADSIGHQVMKHRKVVVKL